MTFEQYQKEWNALKAGVLDCSVTTHFAIECLIAMKYTAKEAETEIQNWLFENAITSDKLSEKAVEILHQKVVVNGNDRNAYHSVIPTDSVIDKRNVPS